MLKKIFVLIISTLMMLCNMTYASNINAKNNFIPLPKEKNISKEEEKLIEKNELRFKEIDEKYNIGSISLAPIEKPVTLISEEEFKKQNNLVIQEKKTNDKKIDEKKQNITNNVKPIVKKEEKQVVKNKIVENKNTTSVNTNTNNNVNNSKTKNEVVEVKKEETKTLTPEEIKKAKILKLLKEKKAKEQFNKIETEKKEEKKDDIENEKEKKEDDKVEKKQENNDKKEITSIEIIKQIEKNLLGTQATTNKTIDIKKSKWNEIDIVEDKGNNDKVKKSKSFNITVENKATKTELATLKDKAYKAINLKQYEIAIKLYKQILKEDKSDSYAKLALATCYQNLRQLDQAKVLYMELVQIFPNDEKIISNLFSIVVNESPYEAVYLLPQLAEKFESSAEIQFQLSVAYSKTRNYSKAISYLKKSLALDQDNIIYMYNLGVLYDISERYNVALEIYKNVAKTAETNNNKNLVPYNELIKRIDELKNLSKK